MHRYGSILIWAALWIIGLFVEYSALEVWTQWSILGILFVVMAAGFYTMGDWKEHREEAMIELLLAGSLLVRFAYCMYVPYGISPHDLGAAITPGSSWYADGHIGYVQYIYEHGCLPKGDPRLAWSYYNPPFYYIIAAAFLRVNHIFHLTMEHMLENLQLLIMLFATLTIESAYRILKEFHIKGRALIVSFAIIAFHPYFIIGGVSLNNDMLSILFLFLTMELAIRWYRKPKKRTIILLALCIGLGMMTKLSVGLIAIPVAVLFLAKFVKEKQYIRYLKEFFLFGAVCVPLGMYWSIRNAIRYQMPLVYVQSLGEDTPQFIHAGLLKRLNPLDLTNLWNPFVHITPKTDYNVWTGLWKTAMFDEQLAETGETALILVSRILLYSSMLLGGMAFILGIRHLIKNRKRRDLVEGVMALTYVLFIGSYLKFCVQFPVVCSMNFRYVVPVLLVGAIAIGRYLQEEKRSRCIQIGIEACTLVFTLSSILLYGGMKL